MKVEVKNTEAVPLSKLNDGDCFIFDRTVYIKSSFRDESTIYGVRPDTGNIIRWNGETLVQLPSKAEMIVSL